ncbi:acyltransferase family protein [Paludibaculum fermentans]|uniref:acyltransferase family protein n=1 Tax=Paludibaculum fermentans TaxID=1473598 RepID=UPI003EBF635F
MNTEPTRYSQALNALRFFAAMWIVFAHFGIRPLGTLGIPAGVLDLLQTRSLATSFFFLLSGFLLTQSLYGKNVRISSFLTRRLTKLYPVHALCFLVMVPTAFVGYERFRVEDVAVHSLLWLSMLHGFFPRVQLLYNSPAWAVTSFALGYLAILWTRRWVRWGTPSLLGVMGILWVIDLTPNLWLVTHFQQSFQYSFPGDPAVQVPPAVNWATSFIHGFPPLRIIEVMFGSVLAILARRVKPNAESRWWAGDLFLSVAGIALAFALSVLGGSYITRYLAGHALLLPVLAVLTLGVWFNRAYLERILSNPTLQLAGSSSMLIYFGHWPVCWGIVWFARNFGGMPSQEVMQSPVIFLLMLIGSVLPALLLQRPYDKFCGVVARRLAAFWVTAAAMPPKGADATVARSQASEPAGAAR